MIDLSLKSLSDSKMDVNGVTTSSINGNIKINNVEKTIYTHPATHASSMITGLSTVATSGLASDVTFSNANFTSTNVNAALNELFTNVGNGKNVIASAITGKGVSALGSDTFAILATKINSIPTPTGDAIAANVLAGKTFSTASGINLVGSMVNRGTLNISPTTTSTTVLPGYYSGGTITLTRNAGDNVFYEDLRARYLSNSWSVGNYGSIPAYDSYGEHLQEPSVIITMVTTGSVRLKFDISSGYVVVTINGSIVSQEFSAITSGVFDTKTIDLTVAANDVISIQGRQQVNIKNIRLCQSVVAHGVRNTY